MDVNYLPLTDMRIARTFCFTNLGQAMYLCSPTEVQRITYSQDTCENLQVSDQNMCNTQAFCFSKRCSLHDISLMKMIAFHRGPGVTWR